MNAPRRTSKLKTHPFLLGGLSAALITGTAACGGSDAPASGGEGQTYKLNFANYSPPTNVTARAMELWAEDVEEATDGAVTVEFFYSEALLPAAEIMPGIADGRADMGYTAAQYHPSELPLLSVTGVPFLTSNSEASARALQEMYASNEALQAEFHEQGIHLLSMAILPSAIVASNEEVNSLDALRGKQIRVVGYQSSAFEAAGASPVGISQPEVYESLQRGTIDMASSTTLDLAIDLNLDEVSDFFTDVGHGGYAGAFNAMNLELWESFSPEVKAAIDEANDAYWDNLVSLLEEREDAACSEAQSSGVTVQRMPSDAVEAWTDVVGDSIIQKWSEDAGKAGASDPDVFLQDYLALYEEYEQDSSYVAGMNRCSD